MNQLKFRQFSDVSEEELVQAWSASNSKEKVKELLKISNFGSKEARLKVLIEKYKLPPFCLKKVDQLDSIDIQKALNDPNVTTLKELCVKLQIAKKMHNATLKKRIIEENLIVPDKLHKAIYEVGAVPWTYPRPHFIKNNQDIPMVCPECNFQASVPRQIQLHHESPSAAEEELESPLVSKKSSLKGNKDYYTSKSVKPICANCHSLEHHPRGEFEKANCGIWLNKKTTNRMFDDHTKMFVTNCPADYTLQKKYFIRTILKTPNDYKCAKCGISEWQGKPLVIQLHHKDSDRSNATLDNLELLCPNCHAATDSWGFHP